MNPYGPAAGGWSVVIPLVIIALVLLRNSRARNLRVERLWMAPVLILAAAALALSHQPPPGPAMIAVDAAALAVGAALGWWRGRFTHISVDPETHQLTSRTSPFGMLLIVGVFAARALLRVFATQNASALHLSMAQVTDALLLLAVGLVCAQRLEIALRATRLLNEARAARSA